MCTRTQYTRLIFVKLIVSGQILIMDYEKLCSVLVFRKKSQKFPE